MNVKKKLNICIIGSGFTGLTAALKLKDHNVYVLESDSHPGGLASGFKTASGELLEKFYHHWFTSDKYIMDLIKNLDQVNKIKIISSNTGMYFNKSFFKLSNPIDLLKFNAISFFSRLRLGFLVLYARKIKNWKALENITAKNWLLKIIGKEAYSVVWEPLLKGKFGPYANKVSAVWFWNKICLRGSSRDSSGDEKLAYFQGGFMNLIDIMCKKINQNGGKILTETTVTEILQENNKVIGVKTVNGTINCDIVISTASLPIFSNLIKKSVSRSYYQYLNKIKYIGNICFIMELDRSLSSYYWLNVNDPSFPFVGIIEHTNFVDSKDYGDRNIVYLSKYLPVSNKLFSMGKSQFLDFALPYIKRMFPDFNENWIMKSYLWRANYSQPIVEKNYSKMIPDTRTPIKNLYLSTMAQIYPEDRGTNYAVRSGNEVAKLVLDDIESLND